MAKNERYIVVLFWEGVGYTYQTDNKVHWFFCHAVKAYEKLAYAKKCAEKAGRKWMNDKVCVFKVSLDDRISCDQYDKWYEDENRLMYEFKFFNS